MTDRDYFVQPEMNVSHGLNDDGHIDRQDELRDVRVKLIDTLKERDEVQRRLDSANDRISRLKDEMRALQYNRCAR